MPAPTSSPNMSMILTPPRPLTRRGSGEYLAAAAATGVKRSHNGHCVTLEPRPRYNMSHQMRCHGRWHGHCLYNTRQGHNGLKGEVDQARDSKKAWVRSGTECLSPDTTPSDKKNKTLLHTQASDRRPRESGGGFSFFDWRKS